MTGEVGVSIFLLSNQGTRFYKHNPSPTFHSYILDFCDVHVHSPLPPTFSLLPTSPLPPLHSYLPCKAFPHCGSWCWLSFLNFCVCEGVLPFPFMLTW